MAAARTTEPARATEGSSGREDADSPESGEEAPPQPAAAAGGFKAWLPLLVTVLAMPLCAYAVTTFLIVPRMQRMLRAATIAPADAAREQQSGGGEKGAEGKAAASGGQKQNAAINKLLVNVAGTMGSRYLLASVVLSGTGSDFVDKVTQEEPQLRDMASGLLCTKTIAELEKPGARNLIRGELLAGFNTIMGKDSVQEIYFTEFAIQ